jgi:hypothetical protein
MASRWEPNHAAIETTSRREAILLNERLARRVVNGGRRILASHVRTGRLSSSLSIKSGMSATDVVHEVGSNVTYALVVHTGARAHTITPRPGGGLSFFWAAAGRKICVKAPVHHPGTTGIPYLTRPLMTWGPKLGYLTVITANVDRRLGIL